MSQLIQVVEGAISPVYCLDNPKLCKLVNICITHDIWLKMKNAMLDVLDLMTLQKTVEMHKKGSKTNYSCLQYLRGIRKWTGTNLLDQKYEEIKGAPQPGRWLGVGINLKPEPYRTVLKIPI